MSVHNLTPQQQRIIFLLCEEGLSQKDTADRLDISWGCLKVYLTTIYQKLNLVEHNHGARHPAMIVQYWKRKYSEAIGSAEGLGAS